MSEERRRYLRDILDEFDRQFGELERSIEDAIRSSFAGDKPFSRPLVAGMAMGVGPEGKPTVRFFGDDLVGPDGFRAPMYEQAVDEAQGVLRLIVELPGVDRDTIDVSALEDRATIQAVNGERRYKLEVHLQKEIDPESGSAKYNNGLLEVVFRLRQNTNKGYRRVRVV